MGCKTFMNVISNYFCKRSFSIKAKLVPQKLMCTALSARYIKVKVNCRVDGLGNKTIEMYYSLLYFFCFIPLSLSAQSEFLAIY